ncbi:MAG TPA: DNA polymerase/3'-5' exonuclease PolX [Myxococcaceae bacterium]|nr:DNA polymerase/3'-5' exonuclease PolX [Myxococcaceae bacterium]
MAPIDRVAAVRALRDISLLLQLKGENAFRCRAYEVGADRLAGLSEDLGSLVAEGKLENLPGIGPALAEKITEMATTGRIRFLDELRSEFPPRILELMKLPDMGPKKVATLWHELQIGDIDSLEAACRSQRVRAIRGFGARTEEKILAGIALYRRSGSRRRLGDVLPVAEELEARVREIPGVIRSSIAGSVRRFCETAADVDLIASAAEPQTVLQAFAQQPEVAQVLGSGESKCSVRLLTADLQADLRVLRDEDFATALHHFTGSKAHHIRLRGRAQDRGLKISEWGVHRGEQKLAVETEEALYELLEMQHVPPELREDWGEVEAAIDRAIPTDLLTEPDILGNVHSHSTWSDGKNSLEEMARAAQARGLKYLTVTEHSQSASYAGGLKPDDLKRQWDEIDRLNSELGGIRLLRGSEVDILETGELDFPESLLEQLEVVIGSIHARYQMDEEQMTRRVLRAFDNPCLHILGHATGRLINSRDPYPLRMEQILDRAAEKGVALEVNGNPHRLDLKAEHVRMALQRGVKLVVSTDAHSVRELGHLRYAVGTARKGWARQSDVLNTLPADRFVSELRQRRRDATRS